MSIYSSLKPADLKNQNKASILRYIYNNGITSKTEICRELGMSKPTSSLLVQELVDKQFLIDAGIGSSTNQGGKRPQLYDFNSRSGAVIAIYIGLNSLQGALIDLKINVISRIEMEVNRDSIEQMLSSTDSVVNTLIEHSEQIGIRVLGIGISAPGVIESKKGVLVNATHFEGLSDVPIGPHLESEFNLPVWVNNESRNMALAEKWFGIGKELDTFITLQTKGGLGTGIILNGEIYQGIDNSGGEFGHTTIDINGPLCRCGNYGCWELYASESVFLSNYKKCMKEHHEDYFHQLMSTDRKLTFNHIQKAIEDQHPLTMKLTDEYASQLGIGIVNLINVFNPEMIVLRGDLMVLGDYFLTRVEKIVRKRSLKPAAQRVILRYSEFKEDTKIIGAATLVIKEVIEGDLLNLN
jgi:N-acetylglucosamine repressor